MDELRSRILAPLWRTEAGDLCDYQKIPDYGNCGVNVDSNNELTVVQNDKNNLHPIAAKMVSLPFLPPNHGFLWNDSNKLPAFNNARWERMLSVYQNFLKQDLKTAKELRSLRGYLLCDKQMTVDVPNYVYNLVNEIPKEVTSKEKMYDNFNHNGGSICYQPLSESNGLVVYASGKNMNKMVVLPIRCDSQKSFVTAGLTKKHETDFNSRIFQVETIRDAEKIYCGLRFHNKIEFGILGEDESGNATHKPVKTAIESALVTHLVLSPYIQGDYLYINAIGEYTLCNMEATCSSCCKTSTPIVTGLQTLKTWSIQYASHPRCFVCSNDTDIILRDLRNDRKNSLLNTNFEFLYENDKLCTIRKSSQNYLHYVATTRSLILLDERYPGHPVLHWKHQMSSPPVIINATNCSNKLFENGEVVALASRTPSEILLFNINHQDSARSLSLSPPLLISKPNDFVDSLMLSNIAIDPIVRMRIEFSLDGVACVPVEDRGLTVLQLTSAGDLFYQDFHDNSCGKPTESGHRSGPGCNAEKLDPEIISDITKWTDDAFEHMTSNTTSSLKANSQIDAADMFKAMLSIKPHTHGCPLCCFCDDKKLDTPAEQICISCGTKLSFSENLIITANETGVLTGTLPTPNGTAPAIPLENNLKEIENNDNPLMQRILNEWLSDGPLPELTCQEQAACSSTSVPESELRNDEIMISINPHSPVATASVDDQEIDTNELAPYFLEVSLEDECPAVMMES